MVGLAVLLFMITVVFAPWRTVVDDPYRIAGSADRRIDALDTWGFLYTFAMLGPVLAAEAVILAAAGTQRTLRLFGTVLVGLVTLMVLLIASDLGAGLTPADTGAQYVDATARAETRPGAAVVLAATALVLLLAAMWFTPSRQTDAGSSHSRRWWLAFGLFVVSLSALLAAAGLPWWRTYFDSFAIISSDTDYLFPTLPAALVAGGLTVGSLTVVGPSQAEWRAASQLWLVAQLVGCGGGTILMWGVLAADPYTQEHGMEAMYPGEGLVLALVGCWAMSVSGALARDDEPRRHSP